MKIILAALLCCTLATSAYAQVNPKADSDRAAAAAPEAGRAPQVQLSQIAIDVGHGQVWGQTSLWACWTKFPLVWGSSEDPWFEPELLETQFRRQMQSAGVFVASAPSGQFIRTDADTSPDIRITAVVTRLWGDLCAPKIGDKKSWKGAIDMEVAWDIYSLKAGKVIARASTRGSSGSSEASRTSFNTMVTEAFANNLKQIMRTEEFAAIITPPQQRAAGPLDLAKPTDLPTLKLLGPKPVRTVPIGDAAGSVVVIITSEGSGSAVLVSSEGYFLTDQHVVGTDKTVKVRWPDGIERPGEVIRTHKGRDVALIKADTRGRVPLAIRLTPVQIGDTVFAIGAPLGQELEGTVTRGIISAHRNLDGLAFLQSDVAVTHGNSGGPLLDEHGAVIGLCELGMTNLPLGLNMFTPVGDALDFLNATVQ